MIKYNKLKITTTVFLLSILMFSNCNKLFLKDGNPDEGINKNKGYFYLIDNERHSVVMLDNNLTEIKSWSAEKFCKVDGTAYDLRGVTTDGKYLFISVAGLVDMVFKTIPENDSLSVISSFEAPPNGYGIIRDLAHDGENLWVLNSGSNTAGIPAQIMKVNVDEGIVLNTYDLPSSSPRSLTYVGKNADVYGRNIETGLYYADTNDDLIYKLNPEKGSFLEAFNAPVPPRGDSYVFSIGLSFDSVNFWVVNSSSTAGNSLFKLEKDGTIIQNIDLPYNSVGSVKWSKTNFLSIKPEINSVLPNSGKLGANLSVEIKGKGFKNDAVISFGNGITVNNLTYNNSFSLTVEISIDLDTQLGSRNITVNTSGTEIIGNNLFTIVDKTPTDGYVLICDNKDGYLRKLRVSDMSIIKEWNTDAFSSSNSLQGLADDGTNIWMSISGSEDKIFQLDTTGAELTVLNSISAPVSGAGTVREIAFDNNGNLWAINSDDNLIYKLDKTNGNVLETISTPNATTDSRGIVFVDDVLYCSDKGTDLLYQYNSSNQEWTELFNTPTPPAGDTTKRYPTGLTWDGVNFWIANSSFEFDYIFQVSVTGEILIEYQMPNPGVNTGPSGICFTYN